jgi:non-homologous end joining protein Ku
MSASSSSSIARGTSAWSTRDEIVKGHEYEKGEYVVIEPQDIAVEEAPYDSMVVRQFVGIDRHTQAPLPDNIDSDAYFQVPPRLVRRVDGRPQSKSES